jgi:hypothetical protein
MIWALVFIWFIGFRCIAALVWNDELCDIALSKHSRSTWYTEWNIIDAIFNPRHYLKWTTKQWAEYLIKEE